MKTFKDFLDESSKPTKEHKDSKGNVLQHGDHILNPHTGDIGIFDHDSPKKKPKIRWHDGGSVSAERLGPLSDWWHKIPEDEFNERAEKLNKSKQSHDELKRILKRFK